MPGIIDDTRYFCLLSITCYTMCIFGIHDSQYLCPDHVSFSVFIYHLTGSFNVLYIPSYQIFPYQIVGETPTMVDWSRSRP